MLGGVAALPSGSMRTDGTPLQPIVTCRPGTFSMTWTNDTNGSRGSVVALWDCPADHLTWSSSAIPLAPGANRITVAIADAQGSSSSAVVVNRD